MFEFFYFPKLNKRRLNSFVSLINVDAIKKCKEEGRGILFLSGHYSNWELTAFSYAELTDEKLNIIAKKQASKKLNDKIDDYRELCGNEIIPIGFSLKKIYEKLKSNEMICFLTDQSAHPDYSSYVKFFGKKVPAFSGPAKIALKLKPKLIFGYGFRNPDYSFEVRFKELEYGDLADYSEDNIVKLTQRISDEFEKIIKMNPGQWLWFHKRFKHMKTDG